MDKRLFTNWVLHIPRRLRDLLWIVNTWSLVAPIFSSLIMSRVSSCVRLYPHFPLELEPLHLCRCPIHFSSRTSKILKSYASMLESFQLHQACHQARVIGHFEMRTSNVNSKKFRSYQFGVSILVPELADLGFVGETLIFKLRISNFWLDRNIGLFKEIYPMYFFS